MTMLPNINNCQMPFVSEYDERNSEMHEAVVSTGQQDNIQTNMNENQNSHEWIRTVNSFEAALEDNQNADPDVARNTELTIGQIIHENDQNADIGDRQDVFQIQQINCETQLQRSRNNFNEIEGRYMGTESIKKTGGE